MYPNDATLESRAISQWCEFIVCFIWFQAVERLERYENNAIYKVIDWNKKKR